MSLIEWICRMWRLIFVGHVLRQITCLLLLMHGYCVAVYSQILAQPAPGVGPNIAYQFEPGTTLQYELMVLNTITCNAETGQNPVSDEYHASLRLDVLSGFENDPFRAAMLVEITNFEGPNQLQMPSLCFLTEMLVETKFIALINPESGRTFEVILAPSGGDSFDFSDRERLLGHVYPSLEVASVDVRLESLMMRLLDQTLVCFGQGAAVGLSWRGTHPNPDVRLRPNSDKIVSTRAVQAASDEDNPSITHLEHEENIQIAVPGLSECAWNRHGTALFDASRGMMLQNQSTVEYHIDGINQQANGILEISAVLSE